MVTMRDSAIRVKRFRELKATLRTERTRLLVGLDIAQAEHVVHLRHAHTRLVVPTLTIPNTTRNSGDTILILIPGTPYSFSLRCRRFCRWAMWNRMPGRPPGQRAPWLQQPQVRSTKPYGVPGIPTSSALSTRQLASVSGRFRMEPDAKRAGYLENGGEARIAVLTESLVETLAT